jgi:putative membrane protein
MRFAAQAGLAEVASSTVAQDRAARSETREFAARMVAEHSAQAAELQALAARFGVTLPTEPDPASQLDLADLNALSGDAFDLAYLQVQVDAHTVTLRAFKTEARHGKNDCVRSWAASYVPILIHHLHTAKETLNAVSPSMGDDDGDRGSDDTSWTDDATSTWDADQHTSTSSS